jgi:hypothetical protein
MHKQSTAPVDIAEREKAILRELYQLNDLKARALQLTESAPLLAAIAKRREELLEEKERVLRSAIRRSQT